MPSRPQPEKISLDELLADSNDAPQSDDNSLQITDSQREQRLGIKLTDDGEMEPDLTDNNGQLSPEQRVQQWRQLISKDELIQSPEAQLVADAVFLQARIEKIQQLETSMKLDAMICLSSLLSLAMCAGLFAADKIWGLGEMSIVSILTLLATMTAVLTAARIFETDAEALNNEATSALVHAEGKRQSRIVVQNPNDYWGHIEAAKVDLHNFTVSQDKIEKQSFDETRRPTLDQALVLAQDAISAHKNVHDRLQYYQQLFSERIQLQEAAINVKSAQNFVSKALEQMGISKTKRAKNSVKKNESA